MKKLYLFAGLGIFFIVYLTVGVPALINLTETNGVLVAFPIFLGVYAILAYFLGATVGHGPLALVLFMFGFLLADIAAPPLLVSSSGTIPTMASAQLSSDVFFFTLFICAGMSIATAWWSTYLIVPMVCAGIIILELKSRALSRYLPKMVL